MGRTLKAAKTLINIKTSGKNPASLQIINPTYTIGKRPRFFLPRNETVSDAKIIPLSTVKRIVKNIVVEKHENKFKVKSEAFDALRMVAEEYLVEMFGKASKIRERSKRSTLMPDDLKTLRDITNCYLLK